jgi:hypothetical protein
MVILERKMVIWRKKWTFWRKLCTGNAAVAPALVVCGAGAGYWLRRLDPMLASIYQQKAHVDIYYCDVVVQPAGRYAQGTGFST